MHLHVCKLRAFTESFEQCNAIARLLSRFTIHFSSLNVSPNAIITYQLFLLSYWRNEARARKIDGGKTSYAIAALCSLCGECIFREMKPKLFIGTR